MGAAAIRLRRATFADLPALGPLIAVSARELGRNDYAPEQVEGALRGAFGTDTQLIRDGTYFVIEAGGRLAGCGGWSRRRTLFGSDARSDRDSTELDPTVDAAKIRAFFIHPEFARRGLGTLLLERCEQAAAASGVDVEVLDLRTLSPWDKEAVLASVNKTRRCIIVHEDNVTAGFGAEIAAVLAKEAFFNLDAPIERLTMPDIPSPHSPVLLDAVVPSVEKITKTIQQVASI